jgi:O-antigen/teichoic acid export membrane protein
MKQLNSRLLKSSTANAFGLAVRIAQQLLIVPVLLTSWSVELYGEWLLISAIPVFIGLSDFGFIAAGSNELARRASQEGEQSAKRFYNAYTVLFQRWSILIALILFALSYVVPFVEIMGLQLLGQLEAGFIFFVLSIAALISQNSLTLLAGLRTKGLYHIGLIIRAVVALTQLILIVIMVNLFDAPPFHIALCMVFTSIFAYMLEWVVLRRAGLCQQTNLFNIRLKLQEPMSRYLFMGMEMMLMPLAQALVLQGTIIIVGKLLGAVAVVMFSTHRTLARLSASILQLFSNPLRAEVGMLQSPEDRPALTAILQLLSRITVWMSLFFTFVLILVGSWIFEFWTNGNVKFNPTLLAILLAGVVAESLWRVSTAIRLGTNRHRPVAWGYLLASLLGISFMIFLANSYGLIGVAASVAFIDIAMSIIAIWTLREMISVSRKVYIKGLIHPPIKELYQLACRFLIKKER